MIDKKKDGRALRRSQKMARVYLAHQVETRMRAIYSDLPHDTARILKIEEKGGVGKSTVQRALNPDAPGSILLDRLVSIAVALDCEVYELLKPPKTEG